MRVLVLSLLFGCATIDSRCEEASKAAAQCHGMDPATFLEACAASEEVADAVLAQDCASSTDGKADGFGEAVFVELCQPVMMTAYLVNDARNPDGAPLSLATKATLRPHFGALVDHVQVHWGSTLLDDWPVVHVRDAFMDVGAQTFGTEIFVAAPSAKAPLGTLAHELVHAKQAVRFGGLTGFYRAYCRAFYQAGFRYDANALEVEAYAEAARIGL